MHGLALTLVLVVMLGGLGMAAGPGARLQVSQVQRLASGFRFTEGPMAHPDGYVIFSDIPADTIYALKGGEPEVFRRPSGNANGLVFDRAGRLLACEHGNRRVSRTEPDGTVTALATHYEGKRLNSPNDIVVRSDGAAVGNGGVYFTDPPYGVKPEQRELDFAGVYRIGPDGALTLLADDFVKPNGLAFSPDERVLYVADTDKSWLRAFDVKDDGTLANGRVFARTEPPAQLRPDGVKVDAEGNVYVAGTDGVVVFSPEGERVETIALPEQPANLAFGGPDGRTLYVTARTSLYKVTVRFPGATWRAGPAER